MGDLRLLCKTQYWGVMLVIDNGPHVKETLTALLKPNTKELSQSTAKAHICLTLRLEPLAKIQYSKVAPVTIPKSQVRCWQTPIPKSRVVPSFLQIVLCATLLFDVFLGMVLKRLLLTIDFCTCGIWGKLGTGVQGVSLNGSAKFPPNPTMSFLEMQSDPSPCITPVSGNHVHAFHTIQPSYLLAYMQPYMS